MVRACGLLLAAMLVLSPPAVAAVCPVDLGSDPSLAGVDPLVRLEFIQKGLSRSAYQARVWHWTWTGINLAIAGGQALAIPFVDNDSRIDRYIGLTASAIGVVSLWMTPLRAMKDSKTLDRRVAGMREGEDPCAVLAEAERYLVRDAMNESRVRKWWPHAVTITFGVALGLVTALVFDHYSAGGLTGAASMTIGELRLATQPQYSVKLLDRYRNGDLRMPEHRKFFWWVSPDLGGVDPRVAHYGVKATVVF